MNPQSQRLIERIRESIIGDDRVLEGPYGLRRVTYADYTASGRSLEFIERFIQEEVRPLYANTHTEASGTGLQTTCFREDSRETIREAVRGTDDDVVIFAGSGATGAINKLVDILNLRIPADLDARYGFSAQIPEDERPVVFIGPYEHHSNELPWRETIADVVEIDEDPDGQIDISHLERELVRFENRTLKIGSFSAASNVTGIVSDTRRITRTLHEHGALAFWDFAAAAPYVRIEMNYPDDEKGVYAKDAIFLSPHKFIGGPGTPGVLVVKRGLVRNRVPTVPGGGTVAYVSATEQEYLTDPRHREEGGTPAIIESVRAGLVFHLKQAVGESVIEERESELVRRAIDRWIRNPNIDVLGNRTANRLSIVSFVVRHGQRFLHHNFVVALLNDLFGIQARGGCSCAGPYGHRLLGIDLQRSMGYRQAIHAGCEGLKPGWVRVNFNYFISERMFEFLLDAVDLVAQRGHLLLDDYAFSPDTGLWSHRKRQPRCALSFSDLSYEDGRLHYPRKHITEPESAFGRYLQEAVKCFDRAERRQPPPGAGQPRLSDDLETLRWFALPGD